MQHEQNKRINIITRSLFAFEWCGIFSRYRSVLSWLYYRIRIYVVAVKILGTKWLNTVSIKGKQDTRERVSHVGESVPIEYWNRLPLVNLSMEEL